MRLGMQEHHNCVFICEQILDQLEKEVKNDARHLKNRGFLGKAWIVADDFVNARWETLEGRLKRAFEDDNDPLNKDRKKVASFFYAAKTHDFRPRFKREIREILEGKEAVDANQDAVLSDIETDEEDIDESDNIA